MQLFAGESPIHTDNGVAATDVDQYQVVYRLADGTVGAFDDTAAGVDTNKPIGISAQATKAGDHVQFYTGGTFNHEVITWPASLDTLVKRKAVFDRTTIFMKELY